MTGRSIINSENCFRGFTTYFDKKFGQKWLFRLFLHSTYQSTRHLGSLTAANWVSFDFNVAYSSRWGYSLIKTLKFKKKSTRNPVICSRHFCLAAAEKGSLPPVVASCTNPWLPQSARALVPYYGRSSRKPLRGTKARLVSKHLYRMVETVP